MALPNTEVYHGMPQNLVVDDLRCIHIVYVYIYIYTVSCILYSHMISARKLP